MFVDQTLDITCCICRFGEFERPDDTHIARFGLCRRYAPRPTDEPNNIGWPKVRPDDFCGEAEPVQFFNDED